MRFFVERTERVPETGELRVILSAYLNAAEIESLGDLIPDVVSDASYGSAVAELCNAEVVPIIEVPDDEDDHYR